MVGKMKVGVGVGVDRVGVGVGEGPAFKQPLRVRVAMGSHTAAINKLRRGRWRGRDFRGVR